MLKVPSAPGGEITDEEYDGVFMECYDRLARGRAHYGDTFTRADLKEDLIEELMDWVNYSILIIVRLRRVLPEFEGQLSKDMIDEPIPS